MVPAAPHPLPSCWECRLPCRPALASSARAITLCMAPLGGGDGAGSDLPYVTGSSSRGDIGLRAAGLWRKGSDLGSGCSLAERATFRIVRHCAFLN